MNAELENLINMALMDGVLTEKEKLCHFARCRHYVALFSLVQFYYKDTAPPELFQSAT